MMRDTPPEWGLGGENPIPSSGSRLCLVFLSRTQTLTKPIETSKKESLPPARARIHRVSMALGPPETRQTSGGACGTQRNPSVFGGGGGSYVCIGSSYHTFKLWNCCYTAHIGHSLKLWLDQLGSLFHLLI